MAAAKTSKKAQAAQPDDPMSEMRQRFGFAVDAENNNRELGREDLRFVTVPGEQWDAIQRKARKNRPCYEFPILRSHWRQVVNDQKKARPGIKVRAVEDDDTEGAELRQGILRNIEATSNAERAYDSAFELLTAAGMGAWRVCAEYASDDAWEQDLRVKPIVDPLSSVWPDPNAKEADLRDMQYCFVEDVVSREEYKRRWPDAEVVDWADSKAHGLTDWFREDTVRVVEYFRLIPQTKTLVLLSNGKVIDKAEITDEMIAVFSQDGTVPVKERKCEGYQVVSSICSGKEELEGPFDLPFSRIPVVIVYANRHFVDGRWQWCGMVRFSRDPQKLLNYNLTTAQETVSKQPKSPYLLTPKMLEGKGVQEGWNSMNAVDAPYYVYTPDKDAPTGAPIRLPPPDLPTAFTALTSIAVDMLKASDGIFDASVGARSNETSGRAIIARQREGDTATFDYQDSLSFGIQATGEILLSALPKVYDTPRAMRVLGKDGGEKWVKLNQTLPNGKVVNDLSAGKYDVSVSTGPSYDTQRQEFTDALVQLSQANPAVGAATMDLLVGSLDFPKAEEVAQRLKLLLPPQIQQAMAGEDQSPAVMQMRGALQTLQQEAERQIQGLTMELQKAQAAANDAESQRVEAVIDAQQLRVNWYKAETDRLDVVLKNHPAANLGNAAAAGIAQDLSTPDQVM